MEYESWLGRIPGVSAGKKIALEEFMGDARAVYRMNGKTLEKISFLTEKEKEAIRNSQQEEPLKLAEEQRQQDIEFVSFQKKTYPERLRYIYQPPYGLYYRGKLPEEGRKSVAVVGARNCSEYGRQVAEKTAFVLAQAGVEIISGMAAGIDGAAQWGAVKGAGCTYGVLGCGVDICYPRQNQPLYERIPQQGGLISEYCPGTVPHAMFFPGRNRIISGLADIVLIIEARKRSGSLITADFALEQGKDIYAVPGRLGDRLSEGTNHLIQQGAGIFLGTEELLREMKITDTQENSIVKKTGKPLEKLERLVYSCLDLSPRSLEELMKKTGLSIGEISKVLNTLRGKECITEVYKNYFIRTDIEL